MKELNIVFTLVSVFGAGSMIYLYSSREIFMRCLGLLLIYLSTLSSFVLSNSSNYTLIIASTVLLILGFLSDYYLPTLRYWYNMIPYSNLKPIFYTSLITLVIIPITLNISASHSLLIGSFLGSIIADLMNPRVKKEFKSMIKVALGCIGGFYGMATKYIIALQMIDIILYLT
ncbi:MAG: hypothetical protein U0457_21330 [Candidatus Sericytochromatia bacterium]